MSGPLDGLKVVALSSTLAAGHVWRLLADFGAEVALLEPPGGSPLRHEPAWPYWGRGLKSIELDLGDGTDLARSLCLDADVVVETFRPGTTERLGLSYEDLRVSNPGLVYASITGFGRTGPHASLPGYEAIVLAKLGAIGGSAEPTMPVVQSLTASAAQLALLGILAALYERERSGLGQQVATSLVQAAAAHDTWNWMTLHVARQQASSAAPAPAPPIAAPRVPMSWVGFGLMVALTADGRWLQFAHATTKQVVAFLRALGIDEPEAREAVFNGDVAQREVVWNRMLAAVRSKTVAEWQEAFDADTDVFAEVFRNGTELLDHPQMLHDHQVVESDVPGYGRVRMPGPLAQMAATPGSGALPLPALDEHRSELSSRVGPGGPLRSEPEAPRSGLPLEGVQIVEFGTFYAAPFGTALLSDLGARVIKLEQLDGDPIRFQVAVPDVGGVKVTQGKESIAVDITKPEGREIALELVRRADMVLRSFRGGVAERLGYDDETLLAINPNLVYLNAPGFGVGGPYGHRPAYAPVIGAGSGFARRNAGVSVPENPDLTVEEVKEWLTRSAGGGVAHADGFAALGVGTALALGLLARARGAGGQTMLTTMLSTLAHVIADDMIEYEGRPPALTVTPDRLGFHALYRLYETAHGWVVLAAPNEREWLKLAAAVDPMLAVDERFGSAESRRHNDEALTAALGRIFRTRTAEEWEKFLLDLDIACVALTPGPFAGVLMDPGGLGDQLGMLTDVVHPIFGPHLRMKPLVSLSRSGGRAGPGCAIGQHTDAILMELGYDPERIAELRSAGIIGSWAPAGSEDQVG